MILSNRSADCTASRRVFATAGARAEWVAGRRTEYEVARAAAGYSSLSGDFGEFAANRIERGSD